MGSGGFRQSYHYRQHAEQRWQKGTTMAKDKLAGMMGDSAPVDSEDAAPPDAPSPRSTYNTEAKFDSSELGTLRLTLAQGLSPQVQAGDAKPGDFLLEGFEPVQTVTLIPAGHSQQRRFVEQGAQRARCWSPNGEQGYGDPGIPCDTCQFAQWTDTGKVDDQGRTINARPPCDEIDSFLCFSVTHGMPVLFNLKGTAMRASQGIKRMATAHGFGYFAIDVTAESKSGKGRSWQQPKVNINPEVERDEAHSYALLAHKAAPVSGALPETTGN